MKKQLFTLIALTLCTCSALVACGKKEAAVQEPETAAAVAETTPAPSVQTPASETPAPDVSPAVAVVSEAEVTGVDQDSMTSEENEFYQILMMLGEQAFYMRDALNQGASIEEMYGGMTEDEYIRLVVQDYIGGISNSERRQAAEDVFTKHFWEIAENYDYNHGSYPDWKKLYDEYSGGSNGDGFISVVTDADSFSSAFASIKLESNEIYSKDGVDFTVEKFSSVGASGDMILKFVNNNSNNKKVQVIVWNVCINGIGTGAGWGSGGQVLVGDEASAPCDISFGELVKTWNAFGVSINDAPIETIGIYYSIQVGSDSEFEYFYTELNTEKFTTGDKLFGTKLGSIDSVVPNQDYTAEIPVTTTLYRYDSVDGIVISAVSNYPCLGNAPSLMIGNTRIPADKYTYGGGASANWIKLSDEATLRREYELGADEPMNLRFETESGSITIIE